MQIMYHTFSSFLKHRFLLNNTSLETKKIRENHNARNPRTGERIYSSEKTSVAFKMAKELKNKINKNEGKIN